MLQCGYEGIRSSAAFFLKDGFSAAMGIWVVRQRIFSEAWKLIESAPRIRSKARKYAFTALKTVAYPQPVTGTTIPGRPCFVCGGGYGYTCALIHPLKQPDTIIAIASPDAQSPKEKPYRINFVCLGNICRSPTAEGVFQHLVMEDGLEGVLRNRLLPAPGRGTWATPQIPRVRI